MRTVVITGVGKGIGKALLSVFLREGWRVIGTVRGEDISENANADLVKLDLSDQARIEECVKEIESMAPSIDVLINNAAVLLDEEETALIPEKLRQTLEINVIGTAAFTEGLLPLIQPGGHIINISSTAGSLGLDDRVSHYPGYYPAYKISKTALNMYTRILAGRLKDIIVSSVHPGWVRTAMGGEEADISPEEAARDIYQFAITRPQTGGFWYKGKPMLW